MTRDDIQRAVLQALGDVAPETDFDHLRPDRALREQIDIDSYDFLRVVVALHDKLQVDIPESDYDKLVTLNSTTDYLAARLTHP